MRPTLLLVVALAGCQLVFPLRGDDGDPMDSGVVEDVLTPSDAPGGRIIFVTSDLYPGKLDGLAGADSRCRGHAQMATLTGDYKAFLSDSTTSANTRMTKQGAFRTVTNELIAQSYADLVDNTLAHAIDIDEHGVVVGTELCAWTGTASNGEIAPDAENCNDWGSPASIDTGHSGSITDLGAGWATGCLERACNKPARLYCVEQ